MSQQFIAHLHAFRGFAIVAIVAAHSWELPYSLSGGPEGSLALRVFGTTAKVLFHDSTLFFALISGLLFALVLEPRGWRRFARSKVVNVIAPYVVMTLVFTYFGWTIGGGPKIFDGSLTDYAVRVMKNLLLGYGFFHLWYIPVLIWLYLLTPAVVRIWSSPNLHWLIGVILLAPLFVSRVWPEQSMVNVVYFLGAYTAGIGLGKNYEAIVPRLQHSQLLIWGVCIITTVALLALEPMRLGHFGVTSLIESLWYVQKLSIAALVIPWFIAREAALPGWLNSLADYAFSIYFLHGILVFAASGLFVYLGLEQYGATAVFLYGLASLTIMLAVCSGFSALLKKLLGQYSRMLVGA